MDRSNQRSSGERVLIHSPFGRDARLIAEVLGRTGIDVSVCKEFNSLVEEASKGAGALLLADETLGPPAVEALSNLLRNQPNWSDLPVLVMTGGGEATRATQHRASMLEPLGNVTLLERPLRTVTLLSAVRTALRARHRQYEISAYIEERERLLVQIADSEKLYRGIGESIDFGIWVTSREGRNIYVSDSFLRLLGITQEQYSREGWRDALHPEEADDTVAAWKDSVENGRAWDRVNRYRGADGQWHPVLVRGVPIRGEDGEIQYWAGINLDVSREKQAENALRESNELLRRSNSDLEQFAYACSHDLREPLRNVKIYSQLLVETYFSQLDDQGREFISTIAGSAQRMEMLIRDLLSYTRIETLQDECCDPIDCRAVLQEVLRDLGELIRDSNAVVTCGELPSLRIHEVHLRQVFQNLIGNAIKYRSAEPPRIHITACPCEGWLFSVADNGIGIDPQYARQIFGIFKRLHGAAQYPGTGIGLAICQKIVERYGGRIWVESQPDRGATFKFTLPV